MPGAVALPPFAEGARVRIEDRRVASGYIRYIMTCALHEGCVKRRSGNARQTAHYGEMEPVAWLAVWHQQRAAFGDAASHNRRCRPTLPEVRAWLEQNGHV